MSQNIQTPYRHRLGPVVISQGIGDTLWGAYIVKPNGSLKRCTQIPTQPTPEGVRLSLDMYTGKVLWKEAADGSE
jgi:glucose dehydrogenase